MATNHAELCEKHLQEIDARLAQLRAYRRALRESVNIWRKENAPERECAREFCDFTERLPEAEIFKKAVDPLLD